MAAMVSKHSGFVTASKWSMTSATGWPMVAIADTSRRGTSTPAPDDASARTTSGSIGSTRFSADARYARRTAGSLSLSSAETHPTRGCLRLAHCARSVVFP